MIYMAIALFVMAGIIVALYMRYVPMSRDVQLNSHRLNSVEKELMEVRELIKGVEGMAVSNAKAIADINELGIADDVQKYNEGVASILTYSRETAKGNK